MSVGYPQVCGVASVVATCIMGYTGWAATRGTVQQHHSECQAFVRLLSNDNRTRVTTCNTRNTLPDHRVNFCFGKRWRGWPTKPNELLAYASSRPLNELVVYTDSDVVTNPSRIGEISDIFNEFRADIVISGERTCWVGHVCTHKEVVDFYGKGVLRTIAPFVNAGGIMGKAGLIANVLRNIDREGDDQLAWTRIYATQTLLGIKVIIDSSMRIFGSLVGASVPWVPWKHQLTCVNKQGIARVAGCRYAPVDLDMTAACDLVDAGIPYVPVFWHGNGPSKEDWKRAKQRRDACLCAQ